MKMNKLMGAVVLGAFALTANVSFAAENAEGVKEHFALTIKTLKEAQDAAKTGNEPACRDNIKLAKQNYKEITGDAAGKPLQDAMKRVNDAQALCEKEGGAVEAAGILAEVVATMEKLRK